MAHRVRMTPVDTAWLRMDAPGNLMMITGVQIFDAPLDPERLRALLGTNLCAHREFRSRASLEPAGAWWVETQPDMDWHLVRIALPGAADEAQLQTLVGQLASQALDPTKPLWQMHLVENFRPAPGAKPTHALIVRIHHCIADGIALVGVLLSLTTDAAHAVPPLPHIQNDATAHRAASGTAQTLRALTANAVRVIDAAGDWLARGLSLSHEVVQDPQQAAHWAQEAVQVAQRVGQDVADLALMPDDTTTSLKGKPSGTKRVAWSRVVPLADVKAIGKALNASVNDVMLACVAGALRAYLLERDEPLEHAELRALIPVNLRHSAGAHVKLGNRFGLVPLLLPIGMPDAVARVHEVQRRMNALKEGNLPAVTMVLLGAAGMAPRFVQQQLLGALARKATAVMTNVPGPQKPLYMAGVALRQLMFWVPQSGDLGVGVSVLSYNGGVQFGLMTDKAMCAQPQAVIDRFVPEFEQLRALALPESAPGRAPRRANLRRQRR